MSNRKRINISVDPETYSKLQKLVKDYQFKNCCELMCSFAHILIDRMNRAADRKYDLPEDDGAYIDAMFDDLGHVEPVPDGNPPKTRHQRKPK